jgi:hypothetical protein
MNGVAFIGMATTSARLAQDEPGLTMKPKRIRIKWEDG